MTRCFYLKALFALSMGTCLLLIGCGKKPETREVARPEITRPPQSEIESNLQKHSVSCEGNQACPNYISKIVVVYGNSFKYCTGFLTDQNTVATSSSCLPALLRLNGQDCSKDIYFFFPRTANRPAERVGCSKVSLVSPIEGQDPILWRDDVAFLELSTPIAHRRQAQIIRDGIQNTRQYSAWMIDQQDDFSAIVKKVTCEGVHNNYVNPLVLNESSPNMMLADCPLTRGGTGAPIVDSRGRVRAMTSRDMDPKLRSYLESTGLLIKPLKSITHATNFACAPTNVDNDMLDERECLKDLTYTRVDRFRSEMLSTNLLFGDLRKKLEDSLIPLSKFVRFGVKLIPKGDIQETEIYPKCFKSLQDWLPGMNGNRNVFVEEIPLPARTFRRAMDPYGRVVGSVVEDPARPTLVQFSLKNLRSSKRSSILMWVANEDNSLRTFQNISEECSSSLL